MGWKTRLAERGQDLEYQANRDRVRVAEKSRLDAVKNADLQRAHEMGMLGAKNQFESGKDDKTMDWKSGESKLDRENALEAIRTKGELDRTSKIKEIRTKGAIDQGIHDATNRTQLQINSDDNSTRTKMHGESLAEQVRQYDTTRKDDTYNKLQIPTGDRENPVAKSTLEATRIINDRNKLSGMKPEEVENLNQQAMIENEVNTASADLNNKRLTSTRRKQLYSTLSPAARSRIDINGRPIAQKVREEGLIPRPRMAPLVGADPYSTNNRLSFGQ